MENKKRIKELEKLIKKHQDLYYNSEPEISVPNLMSYGTN